jgi:subtilisin family serine protease
MTALVAASLVVSGCGSLTTQNTPDLALSSTGGDHARLLVVTVRNPPPPNIPHAGSTARSYDAPAQYAVSPSAEAQAAAIAKTYGLKRAAAWPIAMLGVHCIVFEAPEGVDRAQLLARLRRDERVESAQPMQSFNTLSVDTDDPYRKLQRNLDEMNVTGAHRYSRGEGVRVAVIDTGVDAAHPDLKGRIAEQQNFVDARAAESLPERHGTAVAGIIAANENNREGIVGIAPSATLFAYRACWPTQDASASATCNTLTLAKALSTAIDRKMNIVNLSLSGPSDPLLERIVEVGIRRGTLFVGAAPPHGSSGDDQLFPTSIAGVISVDRVAHPSGADAELFAPGDEVLTLVPNGAYDFMSGSSLSAASVSGGLALLLARDHHLTSTTALELLAKSSRAHSDVQASTVDLCTAMSLLLNQGGCTD